MPAVKHDEGMAGGGEVEERGKGNEEKGEATCDVSFVAVGREGRGEAGTRENFFHTHTPASPLSHMPHPVLPYQGEGLRSHPPPSSLFRNRPLPTGQLLEEVDHVVDSEACVALQLLALVAIQLGVQAAGGGGGRRGRRGGLA